MILRNAKQELEMKLKKLRTEEVENEIKLLSNNVCKVRINWGRTEADIVIRVGSSRSKISMFKEYVKVYENGTFVESESEGKDMAVLAKISAILKDEGLRDITKQVRAKYR